jgi:hypothetical protein
LATVACARGNTPANTTDAAMADASAADAHDDALSSDAGSAACAIAPGVTPVLGGSDDLAAYGSANQIQPGAPLGSDGAAITWDATNLYLTLQSSAFENQFEPLHVYLETGGALGSAVPSTGKQYSNLTPQLPFTANYLVAARQTSDSGTDGPYDGIYTPDMTWDDQATVLGGSNVLVSPDDLTISVIVPWAALGGCPTQMRMTWHVVNASQGNEWKDLVPATATPWQAPGGDYYGVDLTQAPAVASFVLD